MNQFEPAISTEEALRLIADRRRRRILQSLVENGEEPVSIDRLVVGIVDGGATVEETRRDAHDSVTSDLYHNHLPKLDAAGIVEFDRDAGTVQYRPNDDVEGLLRYVSESFE